MSENCGGGGREVGEMCVGGVRMVGRGGERYRTPAGAGGGLLLVEDLLHLPQVGGVPFDQLDLVTPQIRL